MTRRANAGRADYLDALTAHCPKIEVIEGRFQQKARCCRRCGCVLEKFDTALIMSADSDLCPGIRALKRLRPETKIIAAFPPNRRSDDLRRAVDGAFTIGAAKIRQARLPHQVTTPDGLVLTRPDRWR